MSQPSGSMISNGIPNSQLKYQKALKQISKLIQTNKILKHQCQQRQTKLGQDLTSIAIKYDQLSKKYDQLFQQKQRMQQYIDQQQDTHAGLNKQYQTIQRQVKYLNDVLIQQNAQLKKLSAFKDQKGISQLFRSYEEKQNSYKKDLMRLQQHILTQEQTIDTLQQDILEQKQLRERYEDQYNIVSLQVVKYKDLNNYLMNQNQSIINGNHNKNTYYNKNKQIQQFVIQFKSQLQNMKQISYLTQNVTEKQYIKNYQSLLQQKNHISLQLAKLKDQSAILQNKIKQTYQIQEQLANLTLKNNILNEDNNMLKNRITLLQSKQILDDINNIDQQNQFKDFQHKINLLMTKSDPLQSIKNTQDNSHFLMMKSFIIQLNQKLSTTVKYKEIYQQKYHKLKQKYNKKSQQNIILEQNNKIMKGKLQGYQRLTQKLHYQLQRSMSAHEDQIVKMVAITNNLVTKKVQQSKSASVFIKNQFDIQIQKAQRTQKSLSQQLQTYKLQSSSQHIKITDLSQKLNSTKQLLQIYQSKQSQQNQRYKQLQQQNNKLNQNIIKFEQLYHQQKTRHQIILIQKQNLNNKVNLISQQMTQKTYKFEQKIRQKDQTYNNQIRRYKNDNSRLNEQVINVKQQYKKVLIQLQQRRKRQSSSFNTFRQQNDYYNDLEQNYQQLKLKNRILQEELISIQNKTSNIDQINHSIQLLENQIMKKNDQYNDEKRNNILLKRQVQNAQITNNDLIQQNHILIQQIQSLKSKIYNKDLSSTRDTSSSYHNHNKQLQSRRSIQRLNEQITLLQSSLRDQKRNNSILLAQTHNHKNNIDSLNEVLSRFKIREQTLLNKLSQSEDFINTLKDQLQTFRLKNSNNSNTILILKNQISQISQKNININEQLSNIRNRLNDADRKYQKILRQMAGLKYYIGEAQKMIKRLNNLQRLQWDQQRQKQNISSLIDQLNTIIKSSQSQITGNGSMGEYKFAPTSSFGNIQNNNMQNRLFKNSGQRNLSTLDFTHNSFSYSSGNDHNIIRQANALNV